MKIRIPVFFILVCLMIALPSYAQKKVSDLKFHNMQNYNWIRLAEIVPEVTDRVILPVGTVEPHGVLAIDTDNLIPNNIAGEIWEKCNALIASPVNYGVTGVSISRFPGGIRVRPEVFEEYMYDILKDLSRSGFKNILIVNGHGGNTVPLKKAMDRVHLETGSHFMLAEWWRLGFHVTTEVYGDKAQQSGHGDREEAAMVIAKNPELIDREMYERLGKENTDKERLGTGFYMVPNWSTTMLAQKAYGYHDFDLKKAKLYLEKKSDIIAENFLEAVRLWELHESWK